MVTVCFPLSINDVKNTITLDFIYNIYNVLYYYDDVIVACCLLAVCLCAFFLNNNLRPMKPG